jgi:hypothetical protein
MDYTITLTDAQQKAMEYCAADINEWMNNFATNRANIAIREIIEKNTAHCNANSIAIAVGIDAQVQQAYDLGVVTSAASILDAIDK